MKKKKVRRRPREKRHPMDSILSETENALSGGNIGEVLFGKQKKGKKKPDAFSDW